MRPAYGQLHASQANLALQARLGTQQAQSQGPAGSWTWPRTCVGFV